MARPARACTRQPNAGRIRETVKPALLIAALLIALPYARSSIYRFPAPTVFSGNQFYNPYTDLRGAWPHVTWQRANFHAHSRSWSGFTSGRQPPEEVVRVYRGLGYSVPGLSNYHQISLPPNGSSIPIYEHGYNAGKRHQLAIGAHRVEWFDFPLGQFTSHKQLVIDLLARDADLVAIAHPSGRHSYSADDMRQLTGYQLIEIVTGPFPDDDPWDAALSSGRAVWGMANDDNHDTTDEARLGLSWNMVAAPTASRTDVIEALRAGRFYSIARLNDHPAADLTNIETVEFKDGTLTITCTGAIPAFEFFGQNGVVRKTVRDTLMASYTFDATDTYIRPVILSPRRAIYLNPILRWDGTHIPRPMATVDQPATWVMRLSVVAAGVLVAVIRRRWRAPRQASASRAANRNPA